MRDIRPRAEEKARRRVEALHASQGEGEGRPTGKGFESERARARQALREEVSAQRGQSVQKIAAASGEKDDGRILRVAAYCRVSTDDIDQVISIELQKNNYRDMIRANPKWKYAGTYVDDGFSGTNTEHRPAFNLMMKDAMAGKIDMIITKSVSRFPAICWTASAGCAASRRTCHRCLLISYCNLRTVLKLRFYQLNLAILIFIRCISCVNALYYD